MAKQIPLRKLSSVEIGLTQKALRKVAEADPGTLVQVMRVLGKISSIEAGSGDKGPFVKLLGFFRFFNLVTGEIFYGEKAFLPCGAESVAAQFRANKEKDDKAVLQIGFDFYVEEFDFGSGYQFSMESIIPEDKKSIDPLEELMALAKPLPKKIEAPEKKETAKV